MVIGDRPGQSCSTIPRRYRRIGMILIRSVPGCICGCRRLCRREWTVMQGNRRWPTEVLKQIGITKRLELYKEKKDKYVDSELDAEEASMLVVSYPRRWLKWAAWYEQIKRWPVRRKDHLLERKEGLGVVERSSGVITWLSLWGSGLRSARWTWLKRYTVYYAGNK